MAVYKVIQDIEAEDKLVGPLTLRQFIYAGIVIVLGFIAWQLSRAAIFLAIPFVPPILFFLALAAPIGQDQPSEVWLLAKIRFFLKPRRRVWNQDGTSQLVTITAPKKVERVLTDGLSQTEVRSRLSALANTLDSRGWAVKNVSVNLYGQAGYLNNGQGDSDRLISASSLPQDVPITDITEMDDMLDADVSPTAQNLERMMAQSAQSHRQHIADVMAGKAPTPTMPTPQADYWFMNNADQQSVKPGMATFDHNPLVSPGAQQATTMPAGPQTADEAALLDKLHAEKSRPEGATSHLKTILPIGQQPVAKPAPATVTPPAEKPANPDIMRLAHNDDLSVATLARQAKKDLDEGGEVVISLH